MTNIQLYFLPVAYIGVGTSITFALNAIVIMIDYRLRLFRNDRFNASKFRKIRRSRAFGGENFNPR